jgi:hypothetical protein
MVSQQESSQRIKQLEQQKQQAIEISKQKLPRRRFGAGYDVRARQQEIIRQRQQAKTTIKDIEARKQELQEARGQLARQETKQKELLRVQRKLSSEARYMSPGESYTYDERFARSLSPSARKIYERAVEQSHERAFHYVEAVKTVKPVEGVAGYVGGVVITKEGYLATQTPEGLVIARKTVPVGGRPTPTPKEVLLQEVYRSYIPPAFRDDPGFYEFLVAKTPPPTEREPTRYERAEAFVREKVTDPFYRGVERFKKEYGIERKPEAFKVLYKTPEREVPVPYEEDLKVVTDPTAAFFGAMAEDVRAYPLRSVAVYGVGAGVGAGVRVGGAGVKGVGTLVAGAKGARVAGRLYTGAEIGVGAGVLGVYAADVAPEVIAAPTPREKAKILGVETKDLLLFGAGYGTGARVARVTGRKIKTGYERLVEDVRLRKEKEKLLKVEKKKPPTDREVAEALWDVKRTGLYEDRPGFVVERVSLDGKTKRFHEIYKPSRAALEKMKREERVRVAKERALDPTKDLKKQIEDKINLEESLRKEGRLIERLDVIYKPTEIGLKRFKERKRIRDAAEKAIDPLKELRQRMDTKLKIEESLRKKGRLVERPDIIYRPTDIGLKRFKEKKRVRDAAEKVIDPLKDIRTQMETKMRIEESLRKKGKLVERPDVLYRPTDIGLERFRKRKLVEDAAKLREKYIEVPGQVLRLKEKPVEFKITPPKKKRPPTFEVIPKETDLYWKLKQQKKRFETEADILKFDKDAFKVVEVGQQQLLLKKPKQKLKPKTKVEPKEFIILPERIEVITQRVKLKPKPRVRQKMAEPIQKQVQAQRQLEKDTSPRAATKTVLVEKQVQRQFPILVQAERQRQRTAEAVLVGDLALSASAVSDVQAQPQAERLKEKYVFEQPQIQVQAVKLGDLLKQKELLEERYKLRLRRRAKPREKKKRLLFPEMEADLLPQPPARKAWNVYGKVVKTGKYRKLNKRPTTRRRALDLGAYAIDTSLARTFELRPAKGKATTRLSVPVPTDYFNRNREKFRNYRVRRGKKILVDDNRFIEKGTRLLDTPQERADITLMKRMSQLRKRSNRTGIPGIPD